MQSSTLRVKDVITTQTFDKFIIKQPYGNFEYTTTSCYLDLNTPIVMVDKSTIIRDSDLVLEVSGSPFLWVYNASLLLPLYIYGNSDQHLLQHGYIPVDLICEMYEDIIYPLIQNYYGKAPLMPMVHLFRHMNAFTYFWYALEHYRSIQQEWGLSVKEWPDTFINQVNQWIDEEDSMITYDEVITDSHYLYGGR